MKTEKKQIGLAELKKIQLDMLIDVADFCAKNQISYFLAYGTLIGAIRHKGYIPWDDDIDICMPRPDYDKFLKLYNNKKSPYRVVDFSINNSYKLPFAKVNDTRTIIWETMYDKDVFGIYLDVFPIDGCDKTGKIIKRSMRLGQFLNAKKAILGNSRTFKKNVIIAIGKCFLAFVSVKKLLLKMKELTKEIPYEKAEYVANIMYSYGNCEIMRKEELEETVSKEFEGHIFKVPKAYDLYLRQIYDDYMKLPPIEKRVSTHTFEAWWR